MTFPDDTFDLVWACESGEHMPDKAAYVKEMTRVLKPGGTLVIATWCQRDETPETPFRCGRRCGPHLGEVLPSAEARSSCGCYSGGGRGRSPEGAGRRSGTLPVVPTTEKPPTHHQPPNNTPPPCPPAARATKSVCASCTRSGPTPTLCPRRSTGASCRHAGLRRAAVCRSGVGRAALCCAGLRPGVGLGESWECVGRL